jgi:hypothetical protein
MKRGGYDSYGPDEALNRARERGEKVGWDRLFRAAGTAAESGWLIVLAVLIVATVWLTGGALLRVDLLTLALAITVVAALIAARVAQRLVAPYTHPILRRLMWALSATALLLLTMQIGLAVAQLIQLFLDGRAQAPGIRDVQAGVVLFTLVVAIPIWIIHALWLWLRRRPMPQDRAAGGWRRVLPILLVLGVAIGDSIYFAT